MKYSTFFYSLFFSSFALNINASNDLSKNNPSAKKKSLNKDVSVSKINDKSLVIVNKDTEINDNKIQKENNGNPGHQIYQIKTEDGSNIIINFNPKINISNPYGNESSENNNKKEANINNADDLNSSNNSNQNAKKKVRLIKKNKKTTAKKKLPREKKEKNISIIKDLDQAKPETIKENPPVKEKAKPETIKENPPVKEKAKPETIKENPPVKEEEEIDYVVRQVFVDENGKTLETKEYQETDPEKIKQLIKEQNEGKTSFLIINEKVKSIAFLK